MARKAIDRRRVLLATATILVFSSARARAAAPLFIAVFKDPGCGCCSAWVDHLTKAGFKTKVEERDDMNAMKSLLGVPADLSSCHTGVIEGYVIEGHVPAADIKRLVAERPLGKGLAAPGMPVNSPGMEVPGAPHTRYTVWLFQGDGKRKAFAQHGG